MANIDAQIGLRPIKSKYGTAPQINSYTRSTTGIIYEGALLFMESTGPDTYDMSTAAQGYNIIGVAAHYVASDETELKIYDDVDQLYEIQADGNAITTLVLARVEYGMYCDVISNTAGNTLTGQAKTELDTSEVTAVAVAHNVVQLIRLSSDPSNDVTAANEKWIVKILPNVHRRTSGRTITA